MDVLAVGRSSTVEILDLRHLNKEADALAVDRPSIGKFNVTSMQNPSSRNQKHSDMIKDEYFNINDCNNLSLDFGEISNLTHNYYEYEQGQTDIIVRSRLKKNITTSGKILVFTIIFLTLYTMGTESLFARTPPSICLSNNRLAVNHSEFVVKAMLIHLYSSQ